MFDLKKQEDYCLFLLVHLGSSDGSFHPFESEAIHAGAAALFPSLDVQEKLTAAQQLWKEIGLDNASAAIESQLDSLRSLEPAQKKALYALLFDVINADGRVSEAETSLLRKVRTYLLD